jgi:hypothetical protein
VTVCIFDLCCKGFHESCIRFGPRPPSEASEGLTLTATSGTGSLGS